MTGKKLIDYCVKVSRTISEGFGTLACDWFEQLAQMEGKYITALMADISGYGDVAKIVNGVMKYSLNTEKIASSVASLVKRTAADTTLQNAKRYGAEFAWIPEGDTCAYCLELASFGWRHATDNTVKGNHAEHIHPNCDCQFAIRFSESTKYESYNPDKYKEMFDNAEGKTLDEKRNSLRRMQYQENKDRINAQKREAYAERKELEEKKQV